MPIPPTTIGLCGRLTVEIRGERREAQLPGRQGRLVLAFLALNQDRPVSRDELIQAVWGDTAGNGFGQGLNVVLSKLRRALGPGVVEGVRRESVQLTASAQVDLRVAAATLAEIRAATGRGEWAAVQNAAGRVVELCDRGVLVGLDAPWLEEARRAAEELGLEARAALGEAALGLGGPADLAAAARVARTLSERAPYRESSHVLLMRVLEAQGNIAEALRVYDRLRVLLREELGVVPGPHVQAILERLLRQDAADHAAASGEARARAADHATACGEEAARAADRATAGGEEAARAPADGGPGVPAAAASSTAIPPLPFFATRSRAAFVGREAELERLRRYYERVLAGERQLVLLEGEPGIGKTRLAARFAAECHAAGAAVLYGRCDAETLVPYQPFVEAIRGHVAQTPREELRRRLGVHLTELARVLPELAEGDVDGPRGAAADAERYRLFEAVSALLVELARTRPLVLVLDDLHWADRPTLLMLRQAVRATDCAPLLMLVTYRDTERGDALLDTLADLRREHFLERIALSGLTERDASALLFELARQDPRVTGAGGLVEETMGNPFFLEEIVRSLSAAPVDARTQAAEAGVPEGIREVLGRRLARLSQRTVRTLGAASVIGREVPLDVLEAVVGLPEEELDESLEEAVTAQVLLEVPGEYGRFAFSHALVRQTLYDGLGAMRRARLHGRVADALEGTGSDDPAWYSTLAHHFFRSPPTTGLPKAIAYAERAARHADDQLAYEEAARLYGLALEGLDRACNDEARRARLVQALGEAHLKAGNTGAARAAFATAADLARRRDDTEGLARAALGHGTTGHMAGGVVDRTTVALLHEALAALGSADTPLRARLLARLGIELSFSDDRPKRIDLSAAALDVARRLDDPATVGYALIARHWCLWGPENVQERLNTAEALLQLAERANDKKLARQGHRWRMIDLLELGEIEAVDAGIAAFARLAHGRRLSERFYLRLFQAMRALLAGRFDEVEPLSREALQLGERVQDPNASQAHVLQMLALRREQGRLEEMADPVADHVARFPAIPGWRCVQAHLQAELGDEDAARATIDALAADDFAALPLDGLWLGGIAVLAEAVSAIGDPRHAEALYVRLLPYADRNVAIGWASMCAGSASRHLGLLATLLDRDEVAERHFEEAHLFNTAMGAEPWAARTDLAHADLLLRAGDRATARPLLERARERGVALGMRRLVEEADERRGRRAARVAVRVR